VLPHFPLRCSIDIVDLRRYCRWNSGRLRMNSARRRRKTKMKMKRTKRTMSGSDHSYRLRTSKISRTTKPLRTWTTWHSTLNVPKRRRIWISRSCGRKGVSMLFDRTSYGPKISPNEKIFPHHCATLNGVHIPLSRPVMGFCGGIVVRHCYMR
jgi:hypothetical protein